MHAKGDLRGIGFRLGESALTFRKVLPFAGWRRNESLGRLARTEGVIQPFGRAVDDGKGCSAACTRRGISAYSALQQQCGTSKGPSL